ncbi:Crp/Fnr family transcriptional regulator [Sphingomonas endolithica]|uniref:Crp/Fnr family transcriptional regulator n=1 Tax=Sphingomonas endolithica TaxID=2972485 RepID=UPI0021AF5FA7|nr:Crp/Fnr family transcriptional regulator [Sphingomonas sp. ZFBP2030]
MTNAFVEKLRGFGPLSEQDDAALQAATTRARNYPRKHDLIREGDRPGPVFVMLKGWACRYKILPNGTRQVMAFMMPGDCCDLHINVLAYMDHGIQTITQATVATISHEEMTGMFDDHPKIAKAMYISQLVDEGTLRAWIVSMGRRSSIERVAHLMCELYLRARNVTACEEEQLVLPVTQALLADALGMTPVHINRVIKTLREAGAMMLSRGSLQIADPGKLVNIAGFDENYLHRRMRSVSA